MKTSYVLAVSLWLGLISVPIQAQDDHTNHPTTPPAATTPTAPAPGGTTTPAMQGQMHDMMVMMQNTAVWTPQGLVVLQGNRLLQYSTDLQLRRTVVLPIPPAHTATGTPPPGHATPSLRSMVPPKLIPIDNGLIVVRGRQVIRLDRELRVVNQAMLPELPPPTAAEMTAMCPMCAQMMGGQHQQPAPGVGQPGHGTPPATGGGQAGHGAAPGSTTTAPGCH